MKIRLINYLKLIRVHRWFKNILIILPILTTQKTIGIQDYKNLFFLFIIFSLTSSLTYVFNDFIDRKEDSNHPIKKNKPLVNDKLSIIDIYIVTSALLISILLIVIQIPIIKDNIIIIISYFTLSILYTLIIKKIIYLDILLVSLFYIFRIKCGVNEINEDINNLIYLQIYIASIFILLCKRYSDLNYTQNINNIYKNKSKILKFLINIILIFNILVYFLLVNSEYLLYKYGNKPYYITTIFVIISFIQYRSYTLKIF